MRGSTRGSLPPPSFRERRRAERDRSLHARRDDSAKREGSCFADDDELRLLPRFPNAGTAGNNGSVIDNRRIHGNRGMDGTILSCMYVSCFRKSKLKAIEIL